MKQNIALALLLSSPLLADTCCQPLMDSHCYPYAVNPPLTSSECFGFGGHIDFLYWRPYADNNAFANIIGFDAGGNLSIRPQDYTYDWDYGFRLGIEGILPCDDWKIGLDWTDFRTDTTRHIATGSTQFIQLTNANTLVGTIFPIVFNAGASVDAKYRLQLDVIDLLFKREFFVGHAVTLQPYAGLTYLSLRQKADISSIFQTGNGDTPVSILSTEKIVSDFHGVGIVGGFSTTWDAYCNFGFYGDVSTSIVYGKSDANLDFAGAINLSNASSIDYEYDVSSLKASLDLALGIQWRYFLCEDSNVLTLRAGWEQHIYFKQNAFPRIQAALFSFGSNLPVTNDIQPLGDLSVQGLTVSLSYSF